ncbi:hypothetical protein AAA799P11_01234 [Marine Group I thaumarchaeote SCGC AAA799-P11]|uniref:Uncharacterized protein n=1 Tax=Marine Group I thaumarchaeote SCGC AAA799-P11 TaxID=1502295 RepID=A0A087RX73_9ARCH|nr:hypothetical protein AAA799P11_01234 [Marine Group I thaumarchaeote SCGC AAA799-P11]
MNKIIIAGIIIAISIGIIAVVSNVDDSTYESDIVENQDGETPVPVGKNLKIELREGIGVVGNP